MLIYRFSSSGSSSISSFAAADFNARAFPCCLLILVYFFKNDLRSMEFFYAKSDGVAEEDGGGGCGWLTLLNITGGADVVGMGGRME